MVFCLNNAEAAEEISGQPVRIPRLVMEKFGWEPAVNPCTGRPASMEMHIYMHEP